MPGINTTGKPNTSDYVLGRGIVYLGELVSNIPTSYRDVGNATEFNMTVESETLEHQSSRQGLRVTDKEVILSQKVNISLTLDEINFDNLREFFSGETATHTNPMAAAQTEYTAYTGVVLGRWYDIKDSNGVRAYNPLADNALVVKNDTDDTNLVLGTDYELDVVGGRVFLLSSATAIEDGEDLAFSWSIDGDNPAASMDEVRALTTSSRTVALKFIAENPAANDGKFEVQVHKVALKAEGDLSLIGDEFATMQFTGVAESNETADANSPTVTVRSLVYA